MHCMVRVEQKDFALQLVTEFDLEHCFYQKGEAGIKLLNSIEAQSNYLITECTVNTTPWELKHAAS